MPNDKDFVMCRYSPTHKGDRGLIGFASFDEPLNDVNMKRDGGVFRIDYGYKGGGEEFLVHRLDLEAAPHVFKSLEDVASGVISLPKRKAPTPDAPVRLGMRPPTPLPEPESEVETEVTPTIPMPQTQLDPLPPVVPEPHHTEIEPKLVPKLQPSAEELIKAKESRAFDPQLLPGVTADVARQMLDDGIASVDDVLELGVDGLQAYHGIGPQKAALIIGSLQEE